MKQALGLLLFILVYPLNLAHRIACWLIDKIHDGGVALVKMPADCSLKIERQYHPGLVIPKAFYEVHMVSAKHGISHTQYVLCFPLLLRLRLFVAYFHLIRIAKKYDKFASRHGL